MVCVAFYWSLSYCRTLSFIKYKPQRFAALRTPHKPFRRLPANASQPQWAAARTGLLGRTSSILDNAAERRWFKQCYWEVILFHSVAFSLGFATASAPLHKTVQQESPRRSSPDNETAVLLFSSPSWFHLPQPPTRGSHHYLSRIDYGRSSIVTITILDNEDGKEMEWRRNWNLRVAAMTQTPSHKTFEQHPPSCITNRNDPTAAHSHTDMLHSQIRSKLTILTKQSYINTLIYQLLVPIPYYTFAS
jgi:hypothetical protein